MTDTSHGYPRERAALYHAHLTDLDRRDVDFYVDRATEVDGPVLEMACGTGRIYLELLRAGVDADGFDLSADALAVLREEAESADLDPSVWRADMREFATERAYDLVICPFNAFQHLLTIDDQLSALEAVYDALQPGGRFVFDVFVPSFELICGTYDEWQVSAVEFRGETYRHRSRTRIVDEVAQVARVENEAVDSDGERLFETDHRIKLLPKREVELLVERSPFDEWDATGDFSDEPLAGGHSVQVWELGKADG